MTRKFVYDPHASRVRMVAWTTGSNTALSARRMWPSPGADRSWRWLWVALVLIASALAFAAARTTAHEHAISSR
jgi:hypothetical protein